MSPSWPRNVIVLVVAGFAISLVVAPISRHDDDTLVTLGALEALLEDRPTPAVQLLAEGNAPVTLADYAGDVVYLNFWGAFCETCREEMPSMNAFAAEHGGDVRVVAVSIDEDQSDTQRYLEQNFPDGTSFEQLADPGGVVAAQFGTVAVPETYVITPDGTILARLIGGQNFAEPAHAQLVQQVRRAQ